MHIFCIHKPHIRIFMSFTSLITFWSLLLLLLLCKCLIATWNCRYDAWMQSNNFYALAHIRALFISTTNSYQGHSFRNICNIITLNQIEYGHRANEHWLFFRISCSTTWDKLISGREINKFKNKKSQTQHQMQQVCSFVVLSFVIIILFFSSHRKYSKILFLPTWKITLNVTKQP